MKHTLVLNENENKWTHNDIVMIKAFLEFLLTQLHIKKPVLIKLEPINEDDRNIGVNVNLKLAFVDLSERLIIIYCNGRGLLDILRSIAHEMIHVQQKDLGLLPPDISIPLYLPNDTVPGYEFEYEAYGLSGMLVRNFRAILNNKAND